MLDPKIHRDLEAAYKKAKIVGLAMLASVFIYLLVAYIISTTQGITTQTDPGMLNILMAVFLFLALGLGVGLFFIRRALFSPAKAAEATQKGMPGNIFFSATAVAFALAEAPAVLGFMLFILGGGWVPLLSLAVLSIIYFLMAWPRLASWEETFAEALRLSPKGQ